MLYGHSVESSSDSARYSMFQFFKFELTNRSSFYEVLSSAMYVYKYHFKNLFKMFTVRKLSNISHIILLIRLYMHHTFSAY